MYRSSVDGLAEQVRALEEQKSRLEAELANVRSILWPTRALRAAVALVLLTISAVLGGVMTYRHTLLTFQATHAAEERAALRRIAMCNERLAAALQSTSEPEAGNVSAADQAALPP
jgi:hypothetical protein